MFERKIKKAKSTDVNDFKLIILVISAQAKRPFIKTIINVIKREPKRLEICKNELNPQTLKDTVAIGNPRIGIILTRYSPNVNSNE